MKIISKPIYFFKRNQRVGEFDVQDGVLDITDPCYDRDTWCSIFDYQILAGKYECFVDLKNFPYSMRIETHDEETIYGVKIGDNKVMDDIRLSSVRIINSDYINKCANKRWCRKGTVGVDAGLCGFYNHKPDFSKYADWDNFWQNLSDFSGTNCTCDIKPYGITVSSGHGDGSYELFVKTDGKKNIALELRFC